MPDKPLATRNKPHNNQLCADLSRFISAYSVVSHFLRFAWQTTYVKNINDIYGYKIKQGIKVNEDLLELLSIYDKNAKVDTNGNVTVYHRTNADAADFLG